MSVVCAIRRSVGSFVKRWWALCFIKSVEWRHRDALIVCVPAPLGDAVVCCGLLREVKRRTGLPCVAIMADSSKAAIAKMFPHIDCVVAFPRRELFEFALANRMFGRDFIRGRAAALPMMVDANSQVTVHRGRTFLDEYKSYLGIPDYTGFVAPLEIGGGEKSGKEVYIVPEANTIALPVDRRFWLGLAERLAGLGFMPVFNAKPGAYGQYRCEFVSLSEVVLSASRFHAVIGVRCGLLDLFACGRPRCLVVIYPQYITHPQLGRAQLEWVRKAAPNAWDPQKSDDENYRMYYSMHNIFDDSSDIHEVVIQSASDPAIHEILRFLK